MSINNINTKGPLNQTQRAQLATAREVKQNVQKTAKRFRALDGTSADSDKLKNDVVMVGESDKTDLPQSMGNKLARLAVGVLAPEEDKAKASGMTSLKEGELQAVNVKTESPEGKEQTFQYRKLDDGSEIYHGPTKDGYAVVRENKDGTLMMMTSDKPADEAYWDASSWKSAGEPAATPGGAPASKQDAAPKTFAETLRDLASGQQATGPGTVASRGTAEPTQKPEETPASVEVPAEASAPPKAPGFMAPFGQSVAESAEKAKEAGQSVLKDAGDSLKEATEKVEEKSKGVTQSVKDWSQSDTGQKVGDLLFGIANPWKKKG